MEEVGVEFCRVSELGKKDRFLMNGLWRDVVKISGGRVYYRNNSTLSTIESMGSGSKQFVQVVRYGKNG